MKKLIFLFLITTAILFAADATWDESQKPVKQWNDNYSYNFVATFDVLDTLNSRDFQIKARDRDVSWVTFPFYCDLQIDTVGAPTAVSLTVYLLGGFDTVNIPCDTITISSIAKDSTTLTTFNLNDKKYPNYKLQLMADSCIIDLQFY